MSDYIFREARVEDIPFLVDVIIEAEKSGTDNIGLAKTFDIDESELRKYLTQILEEEIDGCEFSVSSFFVAEYEGLPVAALGGWIEGNNEDNLPSAILKANLLGYVVPREKFSHLYKSQDIIKDIQYEREMHTHQLEYSYVKPEHQGKFLVYALLEGVLEKAKLQDGTVKKSYVQIFENNITALTVYRMLGYDKIVKRLESKHPEVLNYFPYHVKLVLEKEMYDETI